MTNWQNLFQRHFDVTSQRDELTELLLGDGVSETKIDSLFDQFGFQPPQEFRDLYTVINGVAHNQTDVHGWWFRPLDSLTEFAESCRLWFEDHPDLASRYFPFIDFGNGESAGYLLDNDGALLGGLFIHNTGAYDYDEDQEWAEFLMPACDTIEAYIIAET